MLVVAEIDHKHIILHVDVQMFLRQAEESGHTAHVAVDAVGVRRALDEQLPHAEQEVKLVADDNLFPGGGGCDFSCHTGFGLGLCTVSGAAACRARDFVA